VRLSLAYTGAKPLAITGELTQAAELAALDGIWVAEHLGRRDAMVPACFYLLRTTRIDIGLVGLSTAGRNPGLLAMEVTSLCELGPGRVRLAIGTGEPRLVERLGRRFEHPVAQVTAFLDALRALLDGETVTARHADFVLEEFRIDPPTAPPLIDVMAVRPAMLRLAARIGDGVVLGARTSRAYLADAVTLVERELVAAGRDRRSFRITALADAVIADDVTGGLEDIRSSLAATPPETAAYLARGVADPLDRIDQVALVARPGDLARALAEYAESGIDELGLVLRGDPADGTRAISQLAASHV
jgi:alkanesulfonate monooxygenase SsuD/methylene tetrahydromethanopterin reductase-like flavin-dependent oxidoreductase (luciferase family)